MDEARGSDEGREGRLRRSLRLSGWSHVRDAVRSDDGYDDDVLRQGLPDNVPLDVLARMPNRKAQQRPTPATQSILNATAAPREVAPKSNLMVPRRRHAASMSNATIRHCSRLAGRGCVELSDPAADGPGKCRGMPRGTRPSNGATHGPPPTNL